ncbi:MAG: hypoxanthine phosphoribosyltransferase [Bacteroidetes bacterium]|nr:hypoxanthine phosphoribosyltransferase [Bacteroidota bacterium]
MQSVKIFDKIFSPLISEHDIQLQVKLLADKISHEYQSKNPLFIAILNGAFMFAADLFRQIQIPAEISFVKFSSYNDLQSSGNVQSIFGLVENIKGRHIIILDDILDTGNTLVTFIEEMKKRDPLSIKTALLIDKKNEIKNRFHCDYACFECLGGFLVGYGMDYKMQGRNIPAIFQLIE